MRWYRIEDGRELLALFIREPDEQDPVRRWVVWTPTGYYDCSPGAEEFIGWHINRGPDRTALFYSASRFRDLYYRPDVIRSVLTTHTVPVPPRAKVDALLADLPPVVRIVDVTQEGNAQAEISYLVETVDGKPVSDVQIQIDGQLLQRGVPRDLPSSDGIRRARVDVPPGEGQRTVSVVVTSASGRQSDAAQQSRGLQVTPRGGPMTGRLYALVVGVSAYRDPVIHDLNFSDDDARAIAAVLQKQKGTVYTDVVVKTLVDDKATRAEIVEQLSWLTDKPTENDVSILYMSGHGLRRPKGATQDDGDEYFFAPHDLDWAGRRIASTGVSFAEIQRYVARVKGRKLIFLDSCHSGQMGEQDTIGLVNSFGRGSGAVVWASSTGNQLSFERPEWKNGAFTLALLDAFYGRAPPSYRRTTGRFTQRQLSTWLDERVSQLTGGAQTPSPVDYSGAAFEVGAVVK